MRQIPLEDFFRNSEHTAYQLSPDGKYISYLAPYKDRLNVFVRRVDEDDTASLRLTSETERSIAGYMWADNERLLFMKDTAGNENYQLYGVRRDGTDLRAYTAFEGVRTSLIDDLEEQPGYVMIGMNKRNAEVFDPYRLNLDTGELTLLAENPYLSAARMVPAVMVWPRRKWMSCSSSLIICSALLPMLLQLM